jgi:lipoyl(octanoyl) transferase
MDDSGTPAPPDQWRCRLWVDPPSDGAWNMAVDEALLEQTLAEGVAHLRMYQWASPTLSLGYFQAYQQRHQHPASQTIDVVRRLSGGGALVHHHELTYSLALPAGHPLAANHRDAYRAAHRTLIAILAAHGLGARMASEHAEPAAPSPEPPPRADEPPRAEPFLCFERRSAEDVVVELDTKDPPRSEGDASTRDASTRDASVLEATRLATTVADVKICGSAQRRRRGALLQHGAVVLRRSQHAPELPGIEAIAPFSIEAQALAEAWGPALIEVLSSIKRGLHPLSRTRC